MKTFPACANQRPRDRDKSNFKKIESFTFPTKFTKWTLNVLIPNAL